ncbi:MAG: hypothetical protein ACTSWY_02735 [Promethearchaeota archaeon]
MRYYNKYSEFKESSFFNFFKVKEINSENLSQILQKVVLEPGGFKEFIDIELIINVKDEIVRARLLLDRKWIGNSNHLNTFAKDIAKSFIGAIVPSDEKDKVEGLVNNLFRIHGREDNVISIEKPVNLEDISGRDLMIINVYLGLNESGVILLDNSKFEIKNITDESGKPRLSIAWE